MTSAENQKTVHQKTSFEFPTGKRCQSLYLNDSDQCCMHNSDTETVLSFVMFGLLNTRSFGSAEQEITMRNINI